MDITEVMEVLDEQYLILPEGRDGADRIPVRELDADDWATNGKLTFGHAGGNADTCWIDVFEGRVTRIVTSPD